MLRFCFRFGFSGACFSNRSYLLKRKSRLKPAMTAEFFSNRLAPGCINPATVLEFTASSSRYDDASIHATRGHPTARRLERRRRGSVGEVVPASATRIAPARSPLHEPGARRPLTLQTTAI